ncbi:MAG TPA: MscL family protein [Thermoplasmata archaeon]|nr:MscL family protein [Thermoplasmata archaeon]
MGSIKDDFVAFINKGNLIQLAVAFVMGAAFSALITALVSDIFTPLIGIAGHFDFSAWVLTVNGSTIMQGAFLNALISFIVIALVVFFVIALPYQRWADRQAKKKAAAAPTTRACPECLSPIPLAAKRCSFCTSVVAPVPAPAAASS